MSEVCRCGCLVGSAAPAAPHYAKAGNGRRPVGLPLRDLIDGVEVIKPLCSASRPIPLMHRVQAQKTGLAVRLRLAPLADLHCRGAGFRVVEKPLAVALVMAQVIKMSDRDGRQPRILGLAIDLEFALQNAPCGWSAQRLMRLIDGGQQLDVGSRVALGKTPPPSVPR